MANTPKSIEVDAVFSPAMVEQIRIEVDHLANLARVEIERETAEKCAVLAETPFPDSAERTAALIGRKRAATAIRTAYGLPVPQ